MKIQSLLLGLLLSVFIFSGCKNPKNEDQEIETESVETETSSLSGRAVYQAEIYPLNSDITGLKTSGKARFEIGDNEVHVLIHMSGTPPNMEHWQHFHGFEDGREAACPDESADANGDGIIDLLETEVAAGTTMVPFNENPEKMDVPKNTYPVSDDIGSYTYEVTIPLDKLEKSFSEAFGTDDLQLENRVLFIHGVPENTKLPASVGSLGDIPAHVTLPIGCGKIHKVQ